MNMQPVRGTKDILADEQVIFNNITKIARDISSNFGFKEISTPIFEFTEVFSRTLGDYSDVVNKEMYNFLDRGGEGITLRPELTAGITRSIISNGLYHLLPLKLFTVGAAFRYERPQKGRQRQFHQISFEYFGNPNPFADSEMIYLANTIIAKLGIKDFVTLEINSLGCKESRNNYESKLVEYLGKYKNDLSEDSKVRLEKNPLRVLDSKDIKDKEIVANAPKLSEHYTTDSKRFFEEVLGYLDLLDIEYKINQNLVRGLDYYNHTVFEFVTDKLGSQGTIMAGGRYDGLVSLMGGKDTPAVGFGVGMERLMELVNFQKETRNLFTIIPIGSEDNHKSIEMLKILRENNICVEIIIDEGNFSKKMKKANKINANYVIIVGEEERKSGKYKIKNMENGQENFVEEKMIIDFCISR